MHVHMKFGETGYLALLGARAPSKSTAVDVDRANPSIRNSQFPIWAKGEGVLGPSKTANFKKYTCIKG